jgi:hypothetical protein
MMITIQNVPAQSNCLAADRQGQGDPRLTLTPSVIPNSNYVTMVTETVSNIFAFFTVIIRRTKTFLITLYLRGNTNKAIKILKQNKSDYRK